MKTPPFTLTDADRTTLESMLSKGTAPVRVIKRATAWLELDRGKTQHAIAVTLHVADETVAAWRDRYHQHGMDGLGDAPRSGRPCTIDGSQRAHITALACSDAPAGHARWSMRLLADTIVEAGWCETISHTTVADILKKTT